MRDLTANLTMLFTEHPFYDRFAAAAAEGFGAVEFFFPYGLDHDRIRRELESHDLDLTLFNLPLGDWDAGERGFAAIPARRDEFAAGVRAAVESAALLRPSLVNTPSGPAPDTDESFDTLVENLRLAASALSEIGVRAVIEPINRNDVPDAFVSTVERARQVRDAVDHPNLGIQYDLYHSLRAGEDPYAVIAQHADVIAHIQIADVPGRHQPGTGAVDFDRFFAAVDASAYAGVISLEYHPEGPTAESLDGLRARRLLADARPRG